jgi:outer membrane protein assembly factor BamD (BamD/ComL family)
LANASSTNAAVGSAEPSSSAAHARPGANSGESEASLVLQAVRALRRDGDPARANALAEEALRRYPHGAQAEEALVVLLKAAEARGDKPAAQRLARTYLATHPAGRFTDLAKRLASGN